MKNFNLIEMAKAMKEHKLRHMWRYVAMIFAVLVMSVANIGMAWADTQVTISPCSKDDKDTYASSYHFVADGTAITSIVGAGAAEESYNSGTPKVTVNGKTNVNATITFTIASGVTITSFKVTGTAQANTTYDLDGSSVTFGTALTSLSKTSSMVFRLHCTDAASSTTKRNTTISSFVIEYTTSGGATTHTVTAATNNASYGSASAASTTVAEGGTTTVTATPNTGYRFVSWAVSGTGSTLSSTTTNPTTLTMGTANTTVTATFEAIPTHTITYTNLKGADNSANPTTYTEGVGVASFANLRHLVGYDFTGWSPSSISSSATTDQTIEAQWTARAAAAGTGTLTYIFGYSDNTITTSSITRNNGALYDATNLTWTGVTIDNSESDARSGKITTTKSYDSGKYLSLTFKIADGYTFTPTEVQLKAVAVTNDKTIRFEFTDNAATPNTKYLEQTRTNGSSVGTLTYDFDASDPVTLSGTVTVKIYAYGETNSWRLGTPITITGTVAAAAPACTAADHVDISGEWAAFIGYPISLTATAYDDEDNAIETGLSYQWYKDGTADGNMIDGATSATYYKASAELSDYGSYYCKVSKAGCSDVFSSAYGIKIMRIHLMWEDGTEVSDYAFHNFAPIGDSKAVCTIALEGYHYSLQVLDGQYGWGDNNNAWFSRSNYWGTTASPWTHGTVDNKTFIDCDIAGDYVFTLDYSSGYKMGVMYPQPTYYYKGNDDAWSSTHEMTKSCDGTYAYFWTKGATSLQAAGRGTNNNNFLIMNAAGNNTIADGNKLEIRDGEATGFGGTDIWGSSNMGKWDGSTNASIYNAGDFYIVVYYPNNSINTTNDPKICASTKLPGNATTADEVVYFEKPASNWGDKAYYRIGHRGTSSAPEMELVPGTARLYQHVLSEWTGYEAWSIANNSSWQGSNNSIYKVDTGDEYDITKSTNYFKCETDGNITIILDDENYTADGCTFYNVNTYSGMLTHTATVSDMTNGSVRLNWTDVNDAAQSATSTTSNLAHTCNLQITGVPATGYDVATLTVNGSNFTSGDTHVLSADATIAATFALHNYNVTYSAPSNGNYTIKVADGTASSASKTATMGQTVAIVATPADASYEFTGWTVTNTSSSADVTSALLAGDKATTASTSFTMPAYDVTIVATFAKKTYTVTYNKGTGDITGSHANDTKTYGVNLTLPGATFSKTGYTQTGWATEEGGSKVYELSGSYTANAAANLYPVWTAKTTAITLEAGEGGTDGSATATYGTSTITDYEPATRTGYTLGNYYKDDGDHNILTKEGTLNTGNKGSLIVDSKWASEDAAVTLYAQWTAIDYTIAYDLAGGNVASDNPTSYTIESSAITLNNPTKTGYTFAGWTGTGLVSATTTVTIAAGSTGNRSYTATWTPIVPSSVSLNKTSTTITVGGTETLTATISPEVVADNTITWSTSDADVATVDGGVVTAVAAGTATISATTVNSKTATCEVTVAPAVTYTVTYEYNGATSGDETESATGASVTLPNPSKTGYTLDGWYTTAGAKVDDGGETYNPTADITLYARWQSACASGSTTIYSLALSGDNGSTQTVTGTIGGSASVNELGKSSPYKLSNDGAYVAATLSLGNYFQSGDVVALSGISKANLMYAGTPNSGTYLGQSTYDSDTKTGSYTLPASLPANTTTIYVSRPSTLPAGVSGTWNSTISGMAITRSGGGTCYHVYYHGNGAESGFISDPGAYANSATPTVLDYNDGSYALVKDGYEFQGWATSAEGPVAKTAGQTVTISSADVHLYAVWAEEVACSTDPTVTAGSNSAVTSTTATVSCASGISSLGTGGCTITSYGFVIGTSTNPVIDGVGVTQHEVGTSYASTGASFSQNLTGLTKNTTYYVRPYATNGYGTAYGTQTSFTTLATYTVTYNGNGATSGDAPVDASSPYDAGSNVTVLDNTGDLAKTNYTFDGWATANDGTGTSYAAEGTISSISANTTLYAKWKQTVTLTTGAQGSGGNQTPYVYLNGTGVSSFTAHTASGYSLQGYYTAGSGGVKVLNANGTFAAANVTDYITSSKWSRTGSTTLYAQWRVSAGSTCYEWDADVTTPSTGTNSYDGLYLTAATIKNSVSFYSGHAADTCFSVSDQGKTLYGHLNGTEIDSVVFAASSSKAADNNTMVVIFCSTQTFDTANIIKVNNYQATLYTVNQNTAAKTVHRIKAPAGTKSFAIGRNYANITVSGTLHNSGERYLYYLKVCSASGGTHTISYDNGGGTGTMSAETDIEDDGSQTLTTNTFTAPTNFAFAGWVADVDVTIGGSTVTAGTLIANGATITNITSDIALTAKWSQTITLDDNDANHGATGDGSATVYYNATSLASITHTTAASGYKLAGYYTDATSGTKVLNADGSFAGTAITGYIADGKWTQNTSSTPKLYAQYETAGSIKWNLQVNSADSPILTSSKNSSYTQISTSNMTNLDSISLNITASKKASMTSKISAPTSYDGDKYMKVTFQVASGYQFKPSSIKVPIQPESGSADVKLVLVDNAATPNSIDKEQTSLSQGSLTTVEMTNSSVAFTGTVTLKIYCYGSSTGTYRLGTPIQIDGVIEDACTMPSYTSVSYSQTEYVQPASASAISVVGASGDPSYQWKYNSTGDRTSGTNCGTEASVTPSTESTGTLYYWCELTNACGTVKTPAVAITVSASKSTATVTWTDPSTPNYGGGGYTIRATVDQTGWDGNASDLIINAPAGIRIYDAASGTDASKQYVEVKFDVQTAFDRETYSSNIPFTVSADATASYNAISADHNVSYSACTGGGGSAEEELMPVDAAHIDNSTWKGAWVYEGIGMMRYGHGSSDIAAGKDNANLTALTYKMADDDVDTYYKSSANHFGFYTEKAITGVRLYVHTSNDNVTVSGVYIGKDAFTSGTPSSGAVTYEAVYNDDNEALRSGTHSGSAWVDITFDKEVAAEKYGQINLSSNVRIAGIAFISASGSGATLTTTLAFASSSVTKAQSDANFTITPTKGDYSETLGAITYSSSNTDCATVNATTGEVTITATGSSNLTSRITATLAASGCYKSATAYYDLTVTGQECTITSAGTLSADKTVKCSSANVTLTLSGEDDGMTVTWYRDATDVTASVSDHTLTTSAAGSYSVVVSNATCSKRSNSITISNYSAEVAATKIVDKWYIKHGRVTPDIALWSLDEGTHLSSVAWSPSNATGLTAADDFYESDGIVYLKGTEPSSNESSDVEYTLTLTVKDECENTTALSTSDKQITLTHQKNTDKHVLAFVVTGTEKGGWTAGISADETTNVELYNEIAKNFDVQATNIYSTDDEQKLKEYYSQFDILCITDYPNTKTKGVNSKSYVDAIGALIDIRPILTMEAWVSGLTNWKSKGISGTPKSPTTRQYSMLLQCKDHEIFSGTNPTTVGSGDETMYRIDMVDKTLEDYATLDATYGAGAHAEKSGYEYGSKPALQGFTYDASMSSLLPIGRIDDGAENDLEVGVERQAVMEARLLVLGINGYAMERLEDDGMTIVINALKYLMKKNAEDISDCSNYFVGGAEGDETNWFNLENWSGSSLPDRTQEVRIVAPCVISETIARASSVKIVTGGTYSHGTKTANGSLTINPTGSLIVEGKIYAATAPNFFEQRTTEPENLVVKANESKTGTLIFDNENGDTQATIEMYSPSHWEINPENGKYVKYWSYVGMPIKDVHIPDYFYGAFTYYFNEAKGWEKRFDNDIMQPFEGIGLSMQEGHKETFYGTMVSTENTDITITNHTGYGDGDNLIGNSWTAPIQIANFDAEDFGSCWATVYIFNTGKGGNTYVNANADNDGAAKAGQWLGVPIGVAGLPEYSGLKVIPAMNAFLVHDTESSSTTLHLDYDKLVRDDATTNSQINEKMRAPSRHPRKKKDVDGLMRIRVVGEKTNTDVWMLQDERFSEGFDNGWEARYNPCDDRSAQLYARSAIGAMCFLALPDLDGTVLGFAPSRDGNDYTFTFQYRGEDEYYLNDLKLQQSVLIDADNNYAFTYEKGDTNRFYVSRTPLAPQTPTGVDNASGATQSTKAIKVIYNDKLYIIRSGRVYSAEGILVK